MRREPEAWHEPPLPEEGAAFVRRPVAERPLGQEPLGERDLGKHAGIADDLDLYRQRPCRRGRNEPRLDPKPPRRRQVAEEPQRGLLGIGDHAPRRLPQPQLRLVMRHAVEGGVEDEHGPVGGGHRGGRHVDHRGRAGGAPAERTLQLEGRAMEQMP